MNTGVKRPEIQLEMLESKLSVPLNSVLVAHSLATHAALLHEGALTVLRKADLAPDQIDRVVYVGGSSLMTIVPETMRSVFPTAEHSFASVFTAVAEGLAVVADLEGR